MDHNLSAIGVLIFNLLLFAFMWIFPQFFNAWVLSSWLAISLIYLFWVLIKDEL